MWILLKLFFSLSAFVYRLIDRQRINLKDGEVRLVDDVSISIAPIWNNYGTVSETFFTTPLASPIELSINLEGRLDRIAKRWGISTEIQTGNNSFDERFYITCDDPVLMVQMPAKHEWRQIVTRIFEENGRQIICDGKNLYASFLGDKRTDGFLINDFAQLSKILSNMSEGSRGPNKKFTLRVLLAEASIWALTCYCITSFIEWNIFYLDKYVHFATFMKVSLVVSALIFLVLLKITKKYLNSSSRTHRVFQECVFLIVFTVPIGSMYILSDLNIHLDQSQSKMKKAEVSKAYWKTRSRRYGNSYSYHLFLNYKDPQDVMEMPNEVMVTSHVFEKVGSYQTKVVVETGKGFFGFEWYRVIRVDE